MTQLSQPRAGTPQLLDASQLQRIIVRLSHEIAEQHPALESLVLVGIRTRGVPLAQRLAQALSSFGLPPPPVAALDPRDYRDDRPRSENGHRPALTALAGGAVPPIDSARVVVVDDVVFTGRTLRAALDALVAEGRPAAVEVLVLVDRGHRELPLRATYVGKNVPTSFGDRVAVRLREVDGVDGAWLQQEMRA
jgi:pyrimidine operon attenuation protein / uracil phosphoribosyltransferase